MPVRQYPTGETDARGRLIEHLDLRLPWVQHLLQTGYAVVDCIDPERAEFHNRQIWGDMVSMGTGIEFENPATLKNPHFPGAPRGLLQTLGAALWPSVSDARNDTETTFKAMFNGSDVLLSWDALAFAAPKVSRKRAREGTDRDVPELANWLHTDERRSRRDLCHWIQGCLALEDLGPAELRTQVVAAPDGMTAQEFTDTFCDLFPSPTANYAGTKSARRVTQEQGWCDHSKEEKQWLAANGNPVAPIVKRGQLFLWCSKMPHANLAFPLPDGQDEYRTRVAVLVNAIPRQVAYPGEVEKRREMLEKKRTSGHMVVSEGVRKGTLKQQLFAVAPHFPGGPSPASFDVTKADLPTMSNFEQYAKPREQWTDPPIGSTLGRIHARTARLCGGYDTGV